jgi:Domain of unknown function (DUF4292)
MKEDLVQQEKNEYMARLIYLVLALGVMASCRSTKKIQTAIQKKDSTLVVKPDTSRNDTALMIESTLRQVKANHIDFTTFTAKVNVDYKGGDGKSYDVNANVRMYKDSAIWINVNALLGIDAMRVLITRDSVKLLDKLNKTYMARSVDYLQDVTALPLDLSTLQDLIIGNPLFLDSNIVSYTAGNGVVSMLSLGEFFKNLLTLNEADKALLHSKLDDADVTRNRTADLTYNDYENKKGVPFSTQRRITVAEKTRLDIKLDFKQYDFGGEVSFPFSIPKNYARK